MRTQIYTTLVPIWKNNLDKLNLDYNKPFKKQYIFYLLISKIYIIIKNKELI
jgi:hypothetical protein